jgi:hypothetical protein
MVFVEIWACNSGEHFKVKPQRLQRIRKFPPRGITGMKNSVNHRFDSIAVNTVERLHCLDGAPHSFLLDSLTLVSKNFS